MTLSTSTAALADAVPQSIAATRLWCHVCAAAKPFRNKQLAERSRQRTPGFHGELCSCAGCGTTIVTLYVEEGAIDG